MYMHFWQGDIHNHDSGDHTPPYCSNWPPTRIGDNPTGPELDFNMIFCQ